MKNNHLECATKCWDCRHECQKTLFNYCLQEDVGHTESTHVKLMVDCIQICQVAADFMTRHSNFHKKICEVCAEVCDACANSCENLGDEQMRECAKKCRECAESCRAMS